MQVWRIESIEGRGPYHEDWDGLCDMGDQHNRDNAHPHPHFDFMYSDFDPWGGDSYLYKYGMSTREGLVEWFKDFWTDLAAAGFVVRHLEVTDGYAHVGESGQIAYHTEEVQSTETHRMEDFLLPV